MSIPTSVPDSVIPNFDQVLTGDVKIRKICHDSNDDYKITFSKKHISKVLMYQVWSSVSDFTNNERIVFRIKAKKWVRYFFPHPPPVDPFTPTTVMELDHGECPFHKNNKNGCKHVFSINNAKVNKRGQVVFYVSSKDIDHSNTNKLSETVKLLKKIPTGSFHNARFDIDYNNYSQQIQLCLNNCKQIYPSIEEFKKYINCCQKCGYLTLRPNKLTTK
jgi:hypothetical protein